MPKQEKHWCDKIHKHKETNFDTGDLAHKIVSILTDWILHDMSITTDMDQERIKFMKKKMNKILKNAEKIECWVIEANSIYAVYNVDYKLRRKLLLKARSRCFKLTTQFRHIVDYIYQCVNVKKYLDLEKEIEHLANMIKNIMIKDDKRRKEKVKKYTINTK